MSLVPASMYEELEEQHKKLKTKLDLAKRALAFYAKERRIPATLAACAMHTVDGKDLVDDRFGDRARSVLEILQ